MNTSFAKKNKNLTGKNWTEALGSMSKYDVAYSQLCL